jgi:GGDEF domain-containing protein
VAERLRAAVQSSLTGERTVTVSIGYACQTGTRFETAESLFEAADALQVFREVYPDADQYLPDELRTWAASIGTASTPKNRQE